jgi:hypothetical protein
LPIKIETKAATTICAVLPIPFSFIIFFFSDIFQPLFQKQSVFISGILTHNFSFSLSLDQTALRVARSLWFIVETAGLTDTMVKPTL